MSLDLLVDKTSAETFFFDGMYSMTNLIFPNENSKGIEIFIDNEDKVTIH